MEKNNEGKRKYQRYGIEMRLHFRVFYDFKTVVKFQVLDSKKSACRKYSGVSKNISVEGLCFVSRKKLEKGNLLMLEFYAPTVKVPIPMEGEVRWCKQLPKDSKYKRLFHTGVKLIRVKSKSVMDSVYYDRKYNVNWSIVLETVFGSFKEVLKKIKQESDGEKQI